MVSISAITKNGSFDSAGLWDIPPKTINKKHLTKGISIAGNQVLFFKENSTANCFFSGIDILSHP